MIVVERRRKLSDMIDSYGSVRVSEISKLFGLSTETIRKDLKYLDEQGIAKKEFGGAVSINEVSERPIQMRTQENIEIKTRIAERALEFMKGKNVFYIDAGSTLIEFAKLVALKEEFFEQDNLAIVTNSFFVVDYLKKSYPHLYFLGGAVNTKSMSTSGMWTTYALNMIKIDIAFLGTSGFQSHSGPCVKSFDDAEYKKHVINSSSFKVILCDNSKFHSNSLFQYAGWNEIDVLITDKDAPQYMIENINELTSVIQV